jgi:hypothetical protein
MAVLWVKLRDEPRLSWHVVHQGKWTRCGLFLPVTTPMFVDLPQNVKSCNTCAALVLHDQEKAAG